MKTRFPFTSFPNGWFFVAFSHELPPGGVKPLHYFGKDLVVFRTEEGTPHVFDAHCPHLGAHIGYGGKVKGKTIQCPFHGWCFNGNGECMNIPYSSKIPSKAQIKTWPVHEVNGWILVYHHAYGEPPTWEIPELPEYKSQQWISFRLFHRWKMHTHIQEIVENGIDTAHLTFVHRQSFSSFKNNIQEKKGAVYINRLSIKYKAGSAFLGIFGKEVNGELEVISYGLGCQVSRVWLKTAIEMKTMNMFLLTPINEEYIDVNFVISIKKLFNETISSAIAGIYGKETVKALEDDLPIWENKIYLSNPLLCDGDGSIPQFRHWTRQFYSENCKTDGLSHHLQQS